MPPSLAIYSQVAREIFVIQAQPTVGSRLDTNSVMRIPVQQGALDQLVVVAAGREVKQRVAASRSWLVAPTDEDLFEHLQTATAGSRVAVPADMAEALREQRSTHLLLFTRYRSDAKLAARYGSEGSGQLSGLGYYVDQSTEMISADTGMVGRGFLAPYAYFRVTLIDVPTMTVIRTRTTTAGWVLSAARATISTQPWDVLTAQQKIDTLRDLLKAEVERLLPEILAQPW
jgi:hypothetical protein